MPNQSVDVAKLFHALGDPTRLGVIVRLSKGPASVSELAEPVQMALPSFLQHLGILEGAGLIKTQKIGRVRTCSIDPEGLSAARDWIENQRDAWERKLEALDDYIAARMRGDEE